VARQCFAENIDRRTQVTTTTVTDKSSQPSFVIGTRNLSTSSDTWTVNAHYLRVSTAGLPVVLPST